MVILLGLQKLGFINEGVINFIYADITNKLKLTSSLELGYFFLQLSEENSTGKSLTISFNTDNVDTEFSDIVAVAPEYITNDITFNVSGSLTQNVSSNEQNSDNVGIVHMQNVNHTSKTMINVIYSIVSGQITSNVYDVNRDGEVDYVIAIEPGTKIK